MQTIFESAYLVLRKAVAFIRKDFIIQVSYKMAFFAHWAGIFITIFTFYYLSKIIGKQTTGHLAIYGGEYFPFVLIGIAAQSYIGTSITSFSSNITREQLWGTLEIMLTSPTKLSTILISLSLYNFIFASISVFLYVFLGTIFLGINFSNANLLSALVILILTIISFSCIGVISASFTIIFKRGDPLIWLMSSLSAFFGGVFFPISVLPKYLQIISYFIPVTYSLRSLRYSLLKGYPLGLLVPDIIILLGFCIVLVPLSVVIFRWAVRRAKKAGTLAFY
jgi:ABC-2 type transport system permease protein